MRFLSFFAATLILTASGAFAHGGHEEGPHPTLDLPAETAPHIRVFEVQKGEGGFLVRLETEGFTFAPSGAEEAPATGHAHLFINGTLLAEMESAELFLPELPRGPHDFRVVLTSAQHSDFAIAGRVIDARFSFTVE